MTQEEAFLLDILEHPEDDAVLLIFADWLQENGDPDRGEFIRLRVSAHSSPLQSAHEAREQDLLRRNWERWVAPLAQLVGQERYEPWLRVNQPVLTSRVLSHFRGGFISALVLEAMTFLANAEAIFRLAPLTRLGFHGAGEKCDRLVACPELRWARELEFLDYFRAPLGPADMAALAGSAFLGRLTSLRLYRNNLGDRGLEALTRAVWLPGLAHLDLTENGLSANGMACLVRCKRLNNLRVIRLSGNQLGDEGARRLVCAPWRAGLTHLFLDRTELTEVGERALRKEMPHVRIVC